MSPSKDLFLQVCSHAGTPVDPDHRDANPDSATAGRVSAFVRQYLKGVSDTPSIYEACMYNVSMDIYASCVLYCVFPSKDIDVWSQSQVGVYYR